MSRLMLLRHGKAAWPSGVLDIDRPLAGRGQAASVRMGRYLREEGLAPDLVLVSPARRARDTWEAVKPALGEVPVREEARIYEAPVSRLLDVVRAVDPDAAAVLMIGHNPGFEDLARFLSGAGDPDALAGIRQKYPTAGLAVIDLDGVAWGDVGRGGGRLERFVTPRALGSHGDD